MTFVPVSVARGTENAASDVDVVVVGDISFGDVVSAFGPAQAILGREVNPTVYPVAEFRAKLESRHHFVTSLVDTPKIYLMGDEREICVND